MFILTSSIQLPGFTQVSDTLYAKTKNGKIATWSEPKYIPTIKDAHVSDKNIISGFKFAKVI